MDEDNQLLRPFGIVFFVRLAAWFAVLYYNLRVGVTVRGFIVLAIFICMEIFVNEFVKVEFHRYRKRIETLEAL